MLTGRKLTLLHAVRGFAAFYVVIYHAKFPLWVGGRAYINAFPRSEWNLVDYLLFAIDVVSSNGTAMVIVFFVLSGFFIAYSFDKNKWHLKDFYVNRLIRIYIPFIFSVFFSIGILFLSGKINPVLIKPNIDREFNNSLVQAYQNFNSYSFVRTLFFLPNGANKYIGFNIVYWSLLYEAIFYLLIPLIIKRVRLYLFISLFTLLGSFFFQHQNPILKYFLEYSIYFALGLNLFLFLKDNPNFKLIKRFQLLSLIAITFLTVVGLALINYIQISHLLAGLFTVLLITFLINYEIRDNLILTFFKRIGVISYSLYLFHFPVLILMYAVVTRITGVYLNYDRVYWLGVIVAVLVAYPIFYLVENKSLSLISRLKKNS